MTYTYPKRKEKEKNTIREAFQKKIVEQAGAELCQAQHNLGYQ